MKNGQVPFLKHIDEIARVKKELGLKIMMHTGLVDEKMAAGLKNAGIDGVALDIIGAQETIEQVYHMNCTVEDFDRSVGEFAFETYLVPVAFSPVDALGGLFGDCRAWLAVYDKDIVCVGIGGAGYVGVVEVAGVLEVVEYAGIAMAVLFAGLAGVEFEDEIAEFAV